MKQGFRLLILSTLLLQVGSSFAFANDESAETSESRVQMVLPSQSQTPQQTQQQIQQPTQAATEVETKIETNTKSGPSKEFADKWSKSLNLNSFENRETLVGWTANAITQQVGNAWTGLQKAIAKELGRYRIHFSIPLYAHNFSQVSGKFQTEYEYQLEPGFVNGSQIRRDIWFIHLDAGNYLSLNGGIKVTFNRKFIGPNAKNDAAFALPYCVVPVPLICANGESKIPRTAEDLQNRLGDGDNVRMEIFGGVGLGLDKSDLQSMTQVWLSAGYSQSALQLIDIYKHNSQLIRTRFVNFRNRGQIALKAEAKYLPDWIANSFIFRELIRIRAWATWKKTYHPSDDLPHDTVMVDYLYQLGHPDHKAEVALDEVLSFAFAFQFSKLFSPFEAHNDFADTLLEKRTLSDKQWKEDYDEIQAGLRKKTDTRVRSIFKGRIRSGYVASDVGTNISILMGINTKPNTFESFIESFDQDLKKTQYLSRGKTEFFEREFFKARFQKRVLRELDLLMESNDKREPLGISDVVVRNRLQDSSLSRSDLKTARDRILVSLPKPYSDDFRFIDFLPLDKEQTNATLDYQYNLGKDSFRAIEKISDQDLYNRLYEFLDKHPERMEIRIPHNFGNDPEQKQQDFEDFVKAIAKDLSLFLRSSTAASERVQAYQRLVDREIFRRLILSEFLASLLGPEEAVKGLSISLGFSSVETSSKSLRVGSFESSKVYQAISYIRGIIAETGLTLELEMSQDEKLNSQSSAQAADHYNTQE